MKKQSSPLIPIVARAAKIMGSPKALTDALKTTRQAIYNWRKVPAERVLQIEKITGISRHEIRPDLYPIAGKR